MPAFLTHWHVLIETAKRSRDAGNDLGSLIVDASALRRRVQGWMTPPATPPAGAVWDTGPLPSINFSFPGSDISAMAYLGALAPDISCFQKGNFKKKILDYRQRNPFSSQPSKGSDVPWDQYIEPVASACADPPSLSAQVLDLFTNAAEVTYGLTEERSKNFRQDYLEGLQRLRSYLAGSGVFRFLTFNVLTRRLRGDPIIARIAEDLHNPATLNFEQAITYAIHLSEHLCRRAIAYYAALRNTTATASERSRRRSALCEDLRNWNLDTGYTMDITFDEQVTIHLIHNWVHFARLWENEDVSIAQPQY